MKNKFTLLLIILISTSNIFAQNGVKLNPGELYAGSGYDAIVPLQWEELGDPTEYHVYRKEGIDDFVQIAVVSTGSFSSASYIDETVTAGIEYTYIIKDQNDVGMTNESSATCNNTGHSVTIPGWNTSTPTIDGTINAGEWDDAIEIDITNYARIFTTNYWSSETYAYLKVANDKLYIAIKDYNNSTIEMNDQIIMFFDYNNDNLWTGADADQRYIGQNNMGDCMKSRTTITGTYPDINWGSTEYTPAEMQGEFGEGTGYIAWEFSFDITGSYLEGHTDNFAMLLQSSIYVDENAEGLTGLFSPGGIWKAPSTFFSCSVQYDADEDAPEVESLEGTTEIVDNDMNLILTIADQSEIEIVTGSYTINGGDAQDLIMFPSKGTYGYIGTIPAQASATTGTVVFYLEDEHGNFTNTVSYDIEWLTDNNAPVIITISTPSVATPGNIPIISANITDDLAGINEVILYYTINDGTEQSVSMLGMEGIYSAELPDQIVGINATFYISASDFAANISTTETYSITWYNGDWYGNITGQNTDNNFGGSAGITLGLVLDLGDFEGKINKLAYMVPEWCYPPFTWKVVDVNVTNKGVVWTDTELCPSQTVNVDMVANASTWTEIEIESDIYLSGTVGLVLELPNTPDGNYWGRDTSSTDNISWFKNLDNEWAQLGHGNYTDYPGDWTLKAHLFNDNETYTEQIFGTGITAYNYPNPCTDFTNIIFNNPEDGNIKITIIDMNGKIISVIQNSYLLEGSYSVSFNSQNLSSGIYLYQIQTQNNTITKKFIKK